jgi:hypothetical protein
VLPPYHISMRICHDNSIDNLIRTSKRTESIEHAPISLGLGYKAAVAQRSCGSI